MTQNSAGVPPVTNGPLKSVRNHPNRGRGESHVPSPTKEEVRAAREAAGLTQEAAAERVHAKLRTWQDWEYGHNRMPVAAMHLFCILSNLQFPFVID
ncbi:helix-turn-helix domain-containing protein [Sulfuriferula thiophila]|uniref:helix-turn-helix domain-containing protein n=1 Tax=Sulfuriferula thiophila TaxID=1781211 RepID=UPI000F61483E